VIAVAVAVCEVAFWALVLAAMSARYLLRRRRAGAVLLWCVPLVDVALCVFTGVALARGASADWTYGLAAVYVGFSVALGPGVIRWADRRFSRREPDVAGGGAEGMAAEWRGFGRCVLACGLAAAVLGALVLIAGDADRSRALWQHGGWFSQLGLICGVWLLLGPGLTAARERRVRSSR
jgi:hypothetical protein